jgi:hypothetical protein
MAFLPFKDDGSIQSMGGNVDGFTEKAAIRVSTHLQPLSLALRIPKSGRMQNS